MVPKAVDVCAGVRTGFGCRVRARLTAEAGAAPIDDEVSRADARPEPRINLGSEAKMDDELPVDDELVTIEQTLRQYVRDNVQRVADIRT